ncbi:MAG: hypothetical protein ACRDGS_15090 [Chloroflexota bacterium]
MYNPYREPIRTLDPYSLLCRCHSDDLLQEADHARMRKEARRATGDPFFNMLANVAHAGLIAGTTPGPLAPKEAAWPRDQRAEEQPLPEQQSAGGLGGFLRGLTDALARRVTRVPVESTRGD